MSLLHQKCFNHAQREAAACCLGCGRFFCRECVTEHQGRMICAPCLSAQTRPASRHAGAFRTLVGLAQFAGGVAAAAVFFYLAGSVLVSLPDSFHEGSLWKKSWFEERNPRSPATPP